MRDNWRMVLALAGIIVIGAVLIFFKPKNSIKQNFNNDSYYIPKENISAEDLSHMLSDKYAASSTMSCPVTEPQSTTNIIAVPPANSKYSTDYLLLGMDSLKDAKLPKIRSKIKDDCGIGDGYNKKGATLGDLVNSDSEYYEIIAPFNFEFKDSINTNGNDITIVNSDGSIVINISNAVNWFCAGSKSDFEQKAAILGYDWESHSKEHRTIIGSSAASKCTGGNSGTVIGYGDKSTVINIYADGNLISMEDLYK